MRALLERLVARWPGGLRGSLDGRTHRHEASHLNLDSSRARQRLGWRPTVRFDKAIESIFDWHRALHEEFAMREVTVAQIEALAGIV